MNNETYQQLALKSENKDYATCIARLTPEIRAQLAINLRQLKQISETVDVIKKHVFYGKPLGTEVVTSQAISNKVLIEGQITESGIRMVHGLIGLLTETSEIGDYGFETLISGKSFYPCRQDLSEIDTNKKIGKETGDAAWYIALLADSIGWTNAEIEMVNIGKLKARYPEKFTEIVAQNHNGN